MIDWLVRQLFKWDSLRLTIFSEVDFYNSVTRTLDDPEDMKIASAMWCEPDGWRGWTIKDGGSYYFHDVPEKALNDLFEIIYERDVA